MKIILFLSLFQNLKRGISHKKANDSKFSAILRGLLLKKFPINFWYHFMRSGSKWSFYFRKKMFRHSRSIPKMWELPQIMILRTTSKIVGTTTSRKNFSYSYAKFALY
ncbi:hypothetical protein LEP1GSC046_1707 [Leptospira kirschneri serovar Bim str. 1051]|nr:hypothetical protein LEP1GSC042_2097 [Leptospira kirschneri serovar Bim str. PUO 1247]EMN04764.1 hypothetical protein LEP1GSC046_1707 [Leptospira kirschneri serovar Bim str. 1051]